MSYTQNNYVPRKLFSESESDPETTPMKASDFALKRKRNEIEEGEMLRFTKRQEIEFENREKERKENWQRMLKENTERHMREERERKQKEKEEYKRSLREWENNNNNEEEEEERIAFDPRITLEEIEEEKLKMWEQSAKALLELRRLEKIEKEIKRRKMEQLREILGCNKIEEESRKYIGA